MLLYEKYLAEGLGVSFKGEGLSWTTADNVKRVVAAINSCKNLKYLELEGNTLGVEGAKEIGKALESHPELQCALWKDLFTGRLKDEIPKALDYLFAGVDLAGARLQRLDLSDNAIGPVGMAGLAPFFRTPSSFSLEELIVNNQGLGPEGGTTFANALLKCYELSQSTDTTFQLKIFVCGRNRQENKGSKSWAKFFESIGSLEEVSMPQNGINPPGVAALSLAFSKNPHLSVINLEDNTVRHDGAAMLAQVLPSLTKLQKLNLADCLIKSKGAKTIAESVKWLPYLESINLASNEICKEAGLHVAQVLRQLDKLTHVNLSGNEIGMYGVEEILRLLHPIDIVIEDDEGEGDEDEELDESQNNEEEEKSENEEGELKNSGDNTVENSFNLTLSPISSPSSTTLPTAAGVNLVENFLSSPTPENYKKLLPNPSKALLDHISLSTGTNREKERGLIIHTAFQVSKINETGSQTVFDELLSAALSNSTANEFTSSLLTCLGFIRPEDKKCDYLLKSPNELSVKALESYLKGAPASVSVFRCAQFIISKKTLESFTILNSAYNSLLQIIDKRLEPIYAVTKSKDLSFF